MKVPKKSQMHTSFCHRGQGVPCSDSFLCTWHGHCRGGWFGCCSYHVSTLTWRFPGGQGAGPTYGQPSHARLRKIVAGTRGGQCWAWQSWQCAMVKRETCGATRCDQIYPMLEPSFSYKFWLSPCRNEVLAAMDAFWNKTFQAQGWCCVMQISTGWPPIILHEWNPKWGAEKWNVRGLKIEEAVREKVQAKETDFLLEPTCLVISIS